MTLNQLPDLIGTPSQVEWADRIRRQVDADFDRLAGTLGTVAKQQSELERSDTHALIAILEEKRAEVMKKDQAGYFIRNWQEITDQVRQLIQKDARYESIRLAKTNAQTQETHNMTIRPLYDRIIVKRSEEGESSRNGIIIPDSAKEKPQEGEVVAVGMGKRMNDGKLTPLDVRAGDHILFGKYSGSETKVDGTEYTIMREEDVLAILTKSSN